MSVDIDNKLNPCMYCGLPAEKILRENCGPILRIRCPECNRALNGTTFYELEDEWNRVNELRPVAEICADDIFHVHTYRCKHAGDEEDVEYIRRAIELGAKRIIFTDHAPFPGNPFGNRMDIEELPEYIASLKKLADRYIKYISVQIGLEIEYLPSFDEYYRELAANEDIRWLIVGQHFYEYEPGVYSFSDSTEVKNQCEAYGLMEAMLTACDTGYFRVIAHPDRAFRRKKNWTEDMAEMSEKLIRSAIENGIALEQNISSKNRKHQYWNEFWEMADAIAREEEGKPLFLIKGVDAHSVAELVL